MDQYPKMYLYLDLNTHFKCEGLEWMSKIECPARMLIDDSRCADKQKKLADYLKSVDPDSKCKEGGRLPRFFQMQRNLAQERQQKLGDHRQF